ncbi:hypothetical protein MNBD_NITROSPIRAE02-108 [hydrothermal vent metagenome]|uniref:FecR protein domain-containing protein n=1 Tax=hydrothermal vent metagenome TaxID=652676 RepID=A0A3B1CQQ6_9ZZZZ
MKKNGLIMLICLALMFIVTSNSYSDSDVEDDTVAGQVLTVKGSVYLIRNSQKNNAEPQMQLLLRDAVETDKGARTKLYFMDDSILNLGESSRVEIKEYLYTPENKRSRSIYRLINGSLKMVVGRSDLEIHTPTAVAAARGTKFIVWVEGSGDDMYTGIITLESEVVVKNIVKGIAGEVIVKSGQMSRVYMHKPPEVVQPMNMEIMREFSNQTMVLGNTIKGPDRLSGGIPMQFTEGLYMFQPPVFQEPVETSVPVTIKVIFP